MPRRRHLVSGSAGGPIALLLVAVLAGCGDDTEPSTDGGVDDIDPHVLAQGIVSEAADDLSYEVLTRVRRSGPQAALTFPALREYWFADVTRELVDVALTDDGRALLVRVTADWDDEGPEEVSGCYTLEVPDHVPAGALVAAAPVESDCASGQPVSPSPSSSPTS